MGPAFRFQLVRGFSHPFLRGYGIHKLTAFDIESHSTYWSVRMSFSAVTLQSFYGERKPCAL